MKVIVYLFVALLMNGSYPSEEIKQMYLAGDFEGINNMSQADKSLNTILGYMYFSGRGTNRDLFLAAEHFAITERAHSPNDAALYGISLVETQLDVKKGAIVLFDSCLDGKIAEACEYLYRLSIGGQCYNPLDYYLPLRATYAKTKNTAEGLARYMNFYYSGEGDIIDSLRVQNMLYIYSGSIQAYDSEELIYQYNSAADKGSEMAALMLGKLYLTEEGFNNYELAFKWLKKASEYGYEEAYYLLGTMYDEGLYVEKDSEKATEYYWTASKLGFPKGINLKNYDKEKAKKDYSILRDLYTRKCEFGDIFYCGAPKEYYENFKHIFKDEAKPFPNVCFRKSSYNTVTLFLNGKLISEK